MGRIPEGTRRRRRPRRRRRARRVRRVVGDLARRARRLLRRDRRRSWPSAGRSSPALITTRARHAARPVADDPGRPAVGHVRLDARAGRADRVGGADRQLADRARADRRRRRDHAVELPAAPDRREGRAGAGRGLHRRAQAERGRAAERVRARRDHARPSGCRPACSTSSPATARSSARRSSAHPDVDMVSFTGSTRAGRRVSELAAADRQEGRARARRQVAERDPRRRRPRAGRHRRRGQVLPQLGPDLHRADAHARPARPARAGRGDRRRGRRRGLTPGDPFDRRHALGPLVSDAQRERVRGYIEKGMAEGAQARRRRRRGRPRASSAATSSGRRCSPRSRRR